MRRPPTGGHKRKRLLAPAVACLLALAGCGSSSTTTSTPAKTSTNPRSATVTLGSPGTASARTTTTTATASGVAGMAGVVSGTVSGVSATLHAGTHQPRVNQAWPIHFTVTRAGHTIQASVSYEYLLAGQVVAHRSHYTFVGHFSDVFRWPPAAVGYPLTFRAVIAAGGATIDLDYPVRVAK